MIEKKILLPKHTKIRDTYTVECFLGEGAFGSVYKVRHKYLGIQAIKIFHPGSIQKEQEPQLFNEAFILSKLSHANIVRVYEANTFEFNNKRFCYIAMEFVQGGTLSGYLDQEVLIPIDKAIKIQKDICLGLAELHKIEPPLVHRDVKPQNVLLNKKGDQIEAKISDFGLAKHVDPVTRITDAGGTLAYFPPEGFWDYETPASDVFSAGIIFYIMLTGVPPFTMPTGYQTARKKEFKAALLASRNEKPPPPSKYNADLNDEIDDIVLKALEPDIKKRYQNAQEFCAAIDRYQNQKLQLSEDRINRALELGKQYNSLVEAINLLETVIIQTPQEKQNYLKEKYKQTLDNWKKGVIM